MPCIVEDFRSKSEIKQENEEIKQKNIEKHEFILNFLKEVNTIGDIGKENEYYTGEAHAKNSKLLCSICQNIDVSKYSKELQDWWITHKSKDRENLKDSLTNLKRRLYNEFEKKLKIEEENFKKSLTKYELDLLENKNNINIVFGID
jgi:hypothetical protein